MVMIMYLDGYYRYTIIVGLCCKPLLLFVAKLSHYFRLSDVAGFCAMNLNWTFKILFWFTNWFLIHIVFDDQHIL